MQWKRKEWKLFVVEWSTNANTWGARSLSGWIVHRVHSFLVTKIDHPGLWHRRCLRSLSTNTQTVLCKTDSVQWHKSTSDHRLLRSKVDCCCCCWDSTYHGLSVVITLCQNANRNLLTFLSRIRLVSQTGRILIDLDMRKIFSNAWCTTHTHAHTGMHTWERLRQRTWEEGNTRCLRCRLRHESRWWGDRKIAKC